MKINWNFLGGEGVQHKNLPWREYGYFLELHSVILLLLSLSPNTGFSIFKCRSSNINIILVRNKHLLQQVSDENGLCKGDLVPESAQRDVVHVLRRFDSLWQNKDRQDTV